MGQYLKYKNSQIEWVGDVPEHWSIIPNKYLMHKEKNICEKWQGENILSLTMNGVIVRDLNAGGKMPATFDGYQYLKPGNLLMCLFDIDVTPRCVGRIYDNGVTSPAYSNFVLHEGADLDYFYYYYLMVDNTKELLHLAKNLRHSFTEEQLGMLKVPVPPLDEQKKIGAYLNKKLIEIDEAISNIKNTIEEYKKYKAAIIYEIVTGKNRVDVSKKTTDFEWIGEIPETWKINKIRYTTTLNGRIGWQGLTSDEYCDEGAYLITGVNFDHGIIDWDSCVHVPMSRWEEATQIQISENDLLITKDGTVGKVALAKNVPGPTSLNSGVLLIKLENETLKQYLFWILQSEVFKKWFNIINLGNSTVIHLYQNDFMDFTFPVPSDDEIWEIDKELSEKCSVIDSLIDEKEHLIKDLEKYRNAQIYEYVTGKRKVD